MIRLRSNSRSDKIGSDCFYRVLCVYESTNKTVQVFRSAKEPPPGGRANFMCLLSERSDIKEMLAIGGEERSPFVIHIDFHRIHPHRVSRQELLELSGTHIKDFINHFTCDEVSRKAAFQLCLTESQLDWRVHDVVREGGWIIITVRSNDNTQTC